MQRIVEDTHGVVWIYEEEANVEATGTMGITVAKRDNEDDERP